MAVRLFEDREHANSYWKYRISPSEELIDKVLQFHRSNKNSANDLAIDVGCGSGQGTLLLAPHFTRVVGTDISPAQLEMGRKHVNVSNISYSDLQMICMTVVVIQQVESANFFPFSELILGGQSADLHKEKKSVTWNESICPKFILMF
uniref:Zgc:162780 n=1 Tax=Sinocyclocheilus anshuiensis TaxID=1608454 RepID=A0A671SY83_9TELE